MKMQFHKISVQNFLSYGGRPTTIDLDKHSTTIIEAENGAGKTSLVFDAIQFALFGTTQRAIKKGQIVNWINKKECLVELHFAIDDKEIKIVRGVSPDRFDVEIDDDPVWIDLRSTDKQRELNEVTQVSKDILSQLMFIGSDNYSFMSRTLAGRRDFIERILELQVFSRMNEHSKVYVKKFKTSINEQSIKTDGLNKTMTDLAEVRATCREPDLKLIEKLEAFVKQNDKKLEAPKKKLEDLKDAIDEEQKVISTLGSELQVFVDELNKLDVSADECYACGAPIDNSVAVKRIEQLNKEINPRREALDILIKAIDEKQDAKSSLTGKLVNAQQRIDEANAKTKVEKSVNTDQIVILDKKLENSQTELTDIAIKSAEDEAELAEWIVIQNSLKNGEAKNHIVEKFIPWISARIQKYLDLLNFQVLFEFDSQFNETFKARYREHSTYNSFSTGQMAILDLVILLTFRDIAAKLSSVETNLLVIDEFCSDLDVKNTELISVLMSNLENTNFIGLTPKPVNASNYDRVITIGLEQNFSVIK